MPKVETEKQADELNRTGEFGPYHAANGHWMIAPLRFPHEEGPGTEREYRVGDEIRYYSAEAWCAESCDHTELGPLEDW